MKSLEEIYIQYAENCLRLGDSFGYSYWKRRAFEVACLGE